MISEHTYTSDDDDFYDAEDISAASTLRQGTYQSAVAQSLAGLYRGCSPTSQSSEEDLSKLEKLQKAEDELIERKKLAEKRLQKEEAEILQRLEKIERKKQVELHRQLALDTLAKQRDEQGKLEKEEEELLALEAESLARENEIRRKKVLLLREKLCAGDGGHTFGNGSHASSDLVYSNKTSTEQLEASAEGLRSMPAEQLIRQIPENGCIGKERLQDAGDSRRVSSIVGAGQVKVSSHWEKDGGHIVQADETFHSSQGLLHSEPDIVASSKTPPSSATTEPQQLVPLRPPRKKRLSRAGQPTSVTTSVASSPLSEHNGFSSVSQGNSVSAGLSVSSSTVDFFPGGSERSLDIRLATLGRSYVTTEDEAPKHAGSSEASSSQASLARTAIPSEETLVSASGTNMHVGETSSVSSSADKHKGANPLSLHIMQLTKEYGRDTGHESDDSQKSGLQAAQKAIWKGGKQLKSLVEKTIEKLKSVADEVLQRDEVTAEDDEDALDGLGQSKQRTSSNHKGPQDYQNVRPVQSFYGEHTGPVWAMKFSPCGRLLASGGQDTIVRVWALRESFAYFVDLRQKYCESMTSSLVGEASAESIASQAHSSMLATTKDTPVPLDTPFMTKAFVCYRGHTADVLDLAWSKNCFLLSSSMDKTVRLWHVSRNECLCCFQHIDFVTAIVFHPKDDRYFLSGSLDGKLRLWSIPEKKVALWNEVAGPTKLITAANFCQSGKFAVVGTYDGRCIFYSTEQLKYFTLLNVKSSRGRNARGHKITGIEPLPNEDKVLVTSNDSRLRLYDLRDLTMTCKYKGCTNSSSQIKACFSNDGRFIVCGSEDYHIYIWKTCHEFQKFSSARRDRNVYWESIKVHDAVVTATLFAPHPNLFFTGIKSGSLKSTGDKSEDSLKVTVGIRGNNSLRSSGGKGGSGGSGSRCKAGSLQKGGSGSGERNLGEVLVTADYVGIIKVLVKPNESVKNDK